MQLFIEPPSSLAGTLKPPGDKSISHRAAIVGALSEGTTVIEGFLEGNDCLSTLRCLRSLGVNIEGPHLGHVTIYGKGMLLNEPGDILDAGNSGTTMRLLMGVLAGQPFYSVITGDSSLRRRPMGRVTRPLKSMGAQIWGRNGGELAPLSILGGNLQSLSYTLPVASAQVKSSLLLAGLFARGETIISEPFPTRDHSERLLKAAGAALEVEGQTIKITGGRPLKPLAVVIPGDISAAAFFMVAGCIHPHANIILKNVNLNPTRTGIIDALKAMGGQITVIPRGESSGEPVGDIHVSSSKLHGVEIGGALIPRLIDEIPVLAVAAAVASGETLIRDAAELRVKESDRITRVAEELGKMGASIQALPDGFLIQGNGGGDLRGTIVDSHGDHRLGMALAIAALVADRPTMIRGAEAMAVSYPQFSSHMSILGVKVKEE